jgi:hypothetical protein
MSPELENIIAQYNLLPTEIQQVIFYGDLPGFCEALQYIHELNDEQKLFLENEISLILLGFCQREDLEARMIEQLEITPEATYAITQTIDFEIFNPLAEKIAKYVTNIPKADMSHQQGVQSADVYHNLAPIRTMATDMEEMRSPVRTSFNAGAAIDEPVYVSTQPAIEKKVPDVPSYTAPLYQPPKPNVDAPLEKPRWG